MTRVLRLIRAPLLALVVAAALIASLTPVSFLLSRLEGYREGMEIIAEEIGLSEERLWGGLLPDYLVPFVEGEALSTVLAGAAGATVTFTAALALSYGLARAKKRSE
ncbi:MAG: hypothetical protein N3H31_06225 [Candidatus Nezhaarchaeota archaeon]|nr:hypothetical protein [Candidatus Nezhaarchaeota archaeon]